MTRSPLQVLAEYLGPPYEMEGDKVFRGRNPFPIDADQLFGAALDKLAADSEALTVYYHLHEWNAETCEEAASAPTRIEALAKLVEKLKEGK